MDDGNGFSLKNILITVIPASLQKKFAKQKSFRSEIASNPKLIEKFAHFEETSKQKPHKKGT